MEFNRIVSPSRTYVVACNYWNKAGYYFKKFTLPEHIENNAESALAYFMQVLDVISATGDIYSLEDYLDKTKEI